MYVLNKQRRRNVSLKKKSFRVRIISQTSSLYQAKEGETNLTEQSSDGDVKRAHSSKEHSHKDILQRNQSRIVGGYSEGNGL